MPDLDEKLVFENELRAKLDALALRIGQQLARVYLSTEVVIDIRSRALPTLVGLLVAHYQRAGEHFGTKLRREMPADVAMTDEEAAEFDSLLATGFAMRANRQAGLMLATTQRDLKRAIDRAKAQGAKADPPWGKAEIAAVAGEAARSRTISRNVSRASYESQWAAETAKDVELHVLIGKAEAVDVKAELPVVTAEWESQGDHRVRTWHLTADGQTIAVTGGEVFVVRNERLKHPGDTSLGASLDNVINCRCSKRIDARKVADLRRVMFARDVPIDIGPNVPLRPGVSPLAPPRVTRPKPPKVPRPSNARPDKPVKPKPVDDVPAPVARPIEAPPPVAPSVELPELTPQLLDESGFTHVRSWRQINPDATDVQVEVIDEFFEPLSRHVADSLTLGMMPDPAKLDRFAEMIEKRLLDMKPAVRNRLIEQLGDAGHRKSQRIVHRGDFTAADPDRRFIFNHFEESHDKAIARAREELKMLGLDPKRVSLSGDRPLPAATYIDAAKRALKRLNRDNDVQPFKRPGRIAAGLDESQAALHKQKLTKVMRRKIDAVLDELYDDGLIAGSIMRNGKLHRINWRSSRTGNSFAVESRNAIIMRNGRGAHTVMHEHAHHIEFRDEAVASRIRTWWLNRVEAAKSRGESTVNYHPSRPGEPCWEDHFFDRYVGRDYEAGPRGRKGDTFGETLPMGAQALYDESTMRHILDDDPDHWLLTWSILRGY